MKSLKKFLIVIALVLVAITMVACGKKDEDSEGSGESSNPGTAENIHTEEDCTDQTLKSLAAGKKIYVSTVGQAEFALGKSLVADTGCTIESDANDLTIDQVETGSVVVLVVGYTGKGVAGTITKAGEQTRTDGFAAAAQRGDIELIVLFLGGRTRRGENTDSFLQSLLPVAKVAFSWESGVSTTSANYDGNIVTWCGTTPLYQFADESDMTTSLTWILM